MSRSGIVVPGPARRRRVVCHVVGAWIGPVTRSWVLVPLWLALCVSSAFATAIVPPPVAPPSGGPGTVHIDAFNNSTQATVTFNDGAGHSGSLNALVTQFLATYHNSNGTSVTFETFFTHPLPTPSPPPSY